MALMCLGATYPAAPINAKFFDMGIVLSFCKDAKIPVVEISKTKAKKSRLITGIKIKLY